jgi:hypothetical protein
MMAFLAKLKGYRTVLLHVLVGVPALVLMLLDYTKTIDLTLIMDARTAGRVLIGVNILGIVLRYVTTTPIGQSEEK